MLTKADECSVGEKALRLASLSRLFQKEEEAFSKRDAEAFSKRGAATELQQSCNRAATERSKQREAVLPDGLQRCKEHRKTAEQALQQSCNRAATELQQSCNRAATERSKRKTAEQALLEEEAQQVLSLLEALLQLCCSSVAA
jgi:hypothetical protein